MKICIVTYEMEIEGGGLSYSCLQLRDLLLELNHEVNMISSSLADIEYVKGGYDKNLNRSLAYEAKLKKEVSILTSETLVIAFGGGFNGYFASLLSQKAGCRIWLLLRGSDANICKWDVEKVFYTKHALETSEVILGLSQEICDNAKLLVPYCRAIVLPNIYNQKCNNIKPISKDVIIIGTGATHLNEKKGIITLIEMMGLFVKTHPDLNIRLELAGEVDEEILVQYNQKCEELKIRDKVHFLGRKTRKEFRDVQAGWNIYVQGSVCEGLGNSVVDCMSMGIPILLSNIGFIAELANHHLQEIVCKSLAPKDLSEALYRLIIDEDIIYKYKVFYDVFFKETCKNKIQEVWRKLLSEDNKKDKISIPDGILSVVLHDVSGEEHDNITTPIQVFEKFVKDVYDKGFSLCSMRDYVQKPKDIRKRCIVCTFDDGYTGVLINALPIMKQYGFSATVYICTEYIGKSNDWNYKDKKTRTHLDLLGLLQLHKAGWEIGSHGVTHRSLLRLSDEDVLRELSCSKEVLEKEFGPVTSYAYPYGDYSGFVMKIVSKYYENAFLLTQGGVFLEVDIFRIHRYYISEIYKIINCL